MISHWGDQDDGVPNAQRLLRGMHGAGVEVPVLIYGASTKAEERKRLALRFGALAYCFLPEDLLRRIEDVFAQP